jgi:hypothetical protein
MNIHRRTVWVVLSGDGTHRSLPFRSIEKKLAFLYSQFSPRAIFCDLYREIHDDSKLEFLQRGRGVSFHEFELTMKRAEELDVVSSLSLYLKSPLSQAAKYYFYKIGSRPSAIWCDEPYEP